MERFFGRWTLYLLLFGWIGLLVGYVVYGPTDAAALRILEQQNYTQVQPTGFKLFGCDAKSDFYRTGFTAIAPNGERVNGVVCRALFFRNNTIRFD